MITANEPSVWDKHVPVEESGYIFKEEPELWLGSKNQISAEKPLIVDLFCGAGGASTGFEMAGFSVLLGIDHHIPSLQTFFFNHPQSTCILGDIRKIKKESIPRSILEKNIDVLLAGVPCQGFSLNNRKRHSEDKRNFLFLEFIRFLKIFKPRFCVLENVSGMMSTANGAFLDQIENCIVEAGKEVGCDYVVEKRLLNAADFGVPQIRKRLFFIARPRGTRFDWPTPRFGKERPYRTVLQAIGDLPSLPSPGEEKNSYDKPPFDDYQREMREGAITLLNHKAPKHPAETIRKIAETLPGEPMYDRFNQRIRLDWEKPSPTQVCGGIRPQFQFGHPSEPRGLSVRERARIQSFPDRYNFLGGIVQGRVQTGNAVPPLLAKAIAEAIKESMT